MKRVFKVFGALLLGLVVGFAAFVTVCFFLNFRTPAPTDLSQSVQLKQPPAPLGAPVTLKVATFNIWDLYIISTHRVERMTRIGDTLAALNPDIIGLQEAWIEADRRVILDKVAACGLVNHRYFRSGLAGSGLLVISRFAVAEAFFHRYQDGGYPHRVDKGDWWGGKGACLVRVELPGGGCLDFFDTHCHASYGNPVFDATRLHQAQELAAFIGEAATGTSPALLVGDINTRPDQVQYQTLVDTAKLTRPMTVATRIDHIFAVDNPRYRFEVLDTVPIEETFEVDGAPERLSDHTGYLSTIRITPIVAAAPV